jgi:hypothetical protein
MVPEQEAPVAHEVILADADPERFLNGLNDRLAYALEARDTENFQGMVNEALLLENHRGVTECKRRQVRQHHSGSSSRPRVSTSSAGPIFCLLSRSFSQGRRQLDKDFLPHNIK